MRNRYDPKAWPGAVHRQALAAGRDGGRAVMDSCAAVWNSECKNQWQKQLKQVAPCKQVRSVLKRKKPSGATEPEG